MFRWLHRLALIAALATPLPAGAEPPRPRPRDKHWLRAAIEEASAIGLGTAWYWIDRERQVADWDYPSLEDRLTFEAWRFDNNPFPINFAWHAFNGGGFHVLARSNGLSLPASLGYGFATSMAWEYLLEFREKVSINDVIVTPGSGVAIGEFFHWLGVYLNSAPTPRRWHPAAAWTLGFWHTFHDRLDHRRSYALATSNPDRLGFSADIWHRFAVVGGVTRTDVADAPGVNQLWELRLEGELAAIPGYLAPGCMRRFFADGNVSEIGMRVNGLHSIDFRADTLLLGHHAQDIDEGGGRALTVGASLAYQYRKEVLSDWSDRVALMHLPGLALHGHIVHPSIHLRVRARAHPDFAGLDSAAYPIWKAANPGAVEKTILRKHGYYYALGLSGSLRVDLATPYFSLGAGLFHGRYDSQEKLDKDQEEIDTDVDATDEVTDADAFLRVRLPYMPELHLELRYGLQARSSDLGGVHAEQTLHRYTAGIGARF